MASLGRLVGVGSFSYAAGSGDANFTLAVNMMYTQDLNGDGVDEVIFSGFETQPNTPSKYSNTQIAIFGWKSGQFQNLTDQWLPNGLNKVEGVGDVSFGDFNSDGRMDIFLSGFADMEHPVTVYELLNQGTTFTKVALGKAPWQHDSASADINHDGYTDVIATGYGDSPALYLGSPAGLLVNPLGYVAGGSGIALGNFLGDGSTSMILVDHQAWDNKDTALYRFVTQADGTVGLQFVSALPKARFDLPKYNPSSDPLGQSHDIRAINLDFNHDGLDDVIVISRPAYDGGKWPLLSEVQFLKNLGQGQFSDVTEAVLKNYVTSTASSYAPYLADFNHDGLTDIFLSESSWESSAYNSTTILLQQSDGSFLDTARSLLSGVVSNGGGKAALAIGPDGQYYEITETPVYGGNTTVSLAPLLFTERNQSEYLLGVNDAQIIKGLGGDDQIKGMGGDDVLDGGDGLDTGIYIGTYASHTIAHQSNGSFVVTDSVSGRDGVDTLTNVERLQFSDYNVALDTDSANSAGGIYRLYQAAFDRQPDLPGLGYWIKAADNGKSAVTMAEDFTWSKEFLDLFHLTTPKDNYFTGVDVKTLVEGMYTHVLHRAADSGGLNYYTGVIQSHEKTVGRVLAEISDSPENHTAVASAIANGIQYTPYTAQAMTSLHVIDDIDGVVAEPQTMALDSYSTYSDQYQVDLIGQSHDPMIDWMWLG